MNGPRQGNDPGVHAKPAGPAVAALSVVLLVASACGNSRDDAVGDAAARFYGALADRDGAAACDALAPGTRDEVARSAGKPCAEAILEEDVPTVSERGRVSSFGTSAQVRYDGDTTFLARFDDGWHVTAAACTREAADRYDCLVQGG